MSVDYLSSTNSVTQIGIDEYSANTTEGSTLQEDGSVYYEIRKNLYIYVYPMLLVAGVIGNILTLITVQRKALRTMPMSVFISSLAAVDTLVLFLDCLRQISKEWAQGSVFYIDLTSSSEIFCKLYDFIFTSCFTYSAWLVVAVSFQRFIVVWFPLQAKLICTYRNAVITVISLSLPIFVLNLYNIWTWEHNDQSRCTINPDHFNFMVYIVPWLNGALYSYIPVIILIVLNSAIIVRLAKHSKTRDEMVNKKRTVGDRNEHSVTRTVIAICASYAILTIPLSIFYIVQFATFDYIHQGPKMALAEVIILMLAYANHANIFFLYVITSRMFRAELFGIFRCQKTQTEADIQAVADES